MSRETFVRFLHSSVSTVVAWTLFACFLTPLPAIAKSSKAGQSGSGGTTSTTSQQSTQGKPERITAQNLVVQGFEPNKLVLSKERYVYTYGTVYTSKNGRPMVKGDLKVGQVVDIVYLTGGRATEGYSFRPFDKVLVSVRVVANPKQ